MSDFGNPLPTDAQLSAIKRLAQGREPSSILITPEPFDLPAGYVMVTFQRSGFTCGISREGDVSS